MVIEMKPIQKNSTKTVFRSCVSNQDLREKNSGTDKTNSQPRSSCWSLAPWPLLVCFPHNMQSRKLWRKLSGEPGGTDRRGRTGWGGCQDPALTGAPGWAARTGGPLWGWASHHTWHSWGWPGSYTESSCSSGSGGGHTGWFYIQLPFLKSEVYY